VCKCGWTLLSKRSSKKLKARKGSKTKKVFVKDHVSQTCTWLTLPIKRQHTDTDGNCSEHTYDDNDDDNDNKNNNNNCSNTYSDKYSKGNTNYSNKEYDDDSTLHTAAHRPGRPRKRLVTPTSFRTCSIMFSCSLFFLGIATLSVFSSLERLSFVPGLEEPTFTIERFNLASIGHRLSCFVENISQVTFAQYEQWGARTLARNLTKFLKLIFNLSHASTFANASSSSMHTFDTIKNDEVDTQALSVFRVPI
jgi:hypothetical protein